MANSSSPQELRNLILRALPLEFPAFYRAEDIRPRYVYAFPAHVKALRPNIVVVVGNRGAGKSFWYTALQNRSVRELIAQIDPSVSIESNTEIYTGFGTLPAPERYPDPEIICHLLRLGLEARLIWRTVAITNLLPGRLPRDWEKATKWVKQHPEEVAWWLEEKDLDLMKRGVYALILFDALDRVADDWQKIYNLIRGLLQIALEFRGTARIRVKIFLRPDQLEEAKIATFPDASKVVGSRERLIWSRPDSYGLLWQYLANTEGAEFFRNQREAEWDRFYVGEETVWRCPQNLWSEDWHKKLFQQIAGSTSLYTWLANRLADAHGEISPRVFLTAVRVSAEDTQQQHPNCKYALHHESIKKSVWYAARMRVQELGEDYPWIETLMQPLQGMMPSCDFEIINERWKQEQVLQKILAQPVEGAKLPPYLRDTGRYWELWGKLERLGIVRIQNNRVYIPDVFWVGYQLNQQGEVKIFP